MLIKIVTGLILNSMFLSTYPAWGQSNDTGGVAATSNGDIMQNHAPANNTPSKATDASDSPPQSISQACMKQASDKKLTGDNKTDFVKKCKQGKTTRSGN